MDLTCQWQFRSFRFHAHAPTQRSADREESYPLFRTSSGLPGSYSEDKMVVAYFTVLKLTMTAVRCPLKQKGSDLRGDSLLHGDKIRSLSYAQMLLRLQ